MIREFCLAWEKNKGKLEEYIRSTPQSKYSEYKDLVKLIFDLVINPEEKITYDTENITVIDDGDYQGTLIFVLYKDVYQPSVSDYVYTSVDYGSCSGCDTLQGILDYGSWEYFSTDQQVRDYMTLCLHLLEGCTPMSQCADDCNNVKEFEAFSISGNVNYPENGYLLCFYDEDSDGEELNNLWIKLSRDQLKSLSKMLLAYIL